MREHFKHAGGVVDVTTDRLGEGGMTAMRLVEGGMAALGDGWLVEGPDGATLILCFGQQESIRQYTIAFTHNNKKWIITIFCLFLSSGVSSSGSWKPALPALTTTDRSIRCFSSLVSKIPVTFRDMAIATHTCNCARYSWAINIHFYSLHALYTVHIYIAGSLCARCM